MASLTYLSTDDFSIQSGSKGNVLCNKLPNISLVLFYSANCKFCGDVISVFNVLPRRVNGCHFAAASMDRYLEIAKMSLNTISPIKTVPTIIMYVSGRPLCNYTGTKSIEAIEKFIREMQSKMKMNSTFSGNSKIVQNTRELPSYGDSGIPYNIVCEGELCYLSVGEAYRQGVGHTQ